MEEYKMNDFKTKMNDLSKNIKSVKKVKTKWMKN